MGIKIEVTGLKELNDKLERATKKVQEATKEHSVSVKVLFDESFMKKHTNFETMQDFVNAFNKDMSNEEFAAQINSEEWNNYIKENTKFDSWNSILNKAGEEYFQKRLSNIFE